MKLYYTTSQIYKDDWSFYGIFAQCGDSYYELDMIGLWTKVTRPPQIEYYKTCSKIDLEKYVKGMDSPQPIKMFQRTKGIRHNTSTYKFFSPLTDAYVDNAYVDVLKEGDAVPVICALPDGGLLCLKEKSRSFEQVTGEKQCSIFTIPPKYTKDGMFILKKISTSIVPKDFVEDAIIHFENSLDNSEPELN